MKFFFKLFGDPNQKTIQKMQPIIDEINGLEAQISSQSDEGLKNLSQELMANCPKENQGDYLNNILPKAFALVREASKRVLNQRHYDVQLIGGIVLHRGQIAEMRTGEGKTLVATLPLYLNALVGKGAHLVTVNDYLAKVGAGWMGPVYYMLGVTVGVITHEKAFVYDPNYLDESQFDPRFKKLKPVSRKEAYLAHITYGTNNEFGFDYLRDNMAQSVEAMVQRDLHYAIVDEVDSILIDEARTPLIISAPAEEATERYYDFAKLVDQLQEGEDYNVDEKMKAVMLTQQGIERMEKALGVENIYTSGGIKEVHHLEQALKAKVIYKIDKDYVVRGGEILIVDEFTGRLMPGRRYSDGLHQALEAKENVPVQKESLTLATITFQNYFRMFVKLAGMTGTALTEAEEFSKIYKLETISIPTNSPVARKDENDAIYIDEKAKYMAVIRDVKEKNKTGQPVLIGTISIEKNEVLANLMEKNGLNPQVLNAKNHELEAQIIANAGKVNAITIATNMAGRGVDIMLGGVEPSKDSPEHKDWEENHKKVIELGGLHVIGTERHESRRIDNQLRGRAGRQGDPGSSRFFVSTEDDLMRIFGGDRMKRVMQALNLPEDTPIENSIITSSLEGAQKRVEGNNFDIRKHLVEYDDVVNKHRIAIYKRRREILFAQDKTDFLSKNILNLIEEEINQLVDTHTIAEDRKDWNIKEIADTVLAISPVFGNLQEELLGMSDASEMKKYLIKNIGDQYNKVLSEIEEVNQKLPQDGQISWFDVEKSALLKSIDDSWIEHLSTMSSLRQGVGLQGYGQRDPLIEYKKEAYRLFNELNIIIRREVVYNIFKMAHGILTACVDMLKK